MRVLAIDPGFGKVGIAIIEGNKGNEKLLFSDCIETSKGLPHAERIAEITSEIKTLIAQWKPQDLAIEKLFFTTNQKTAMQVAEARGAIISTAHNLGLVVYEYTPLEIKVAITGYGKAGKAQVADMVRRLIKMEKLPRHDDEYDAVACGLTHLAQIK